MTLVVIFHVKFNPYLSHGINVGKIIERASVSIKA